MSEREEGAETAGRRRDGGGAAGGISELRQAAGRLTHSITLTSAEKRVPIAMIAPRMLMMASCLRERKRRTHAI